MTATSKVLSLLGGVIILGVVLLVGPRLLTLWRNDATTEKTNVLTTLGSLQIETYNPVVLSALEDSTNLYFKVTNQGEAAVTVHGLELGTPEAVIAKPISDNFIKHFFALQEPSQTIASGATKTFEYMIAGKSDIGANTTIDFSFSIEETGDSSAIPITIQSGAFNVLQSLELSATITGTVTDNAGASLAGVAVELFTFAGRDSWRSTTDTRGQYTITFPATEDIQTVLGDRPLPYASTDFFLLAEREGYELGFVGDIVGARGEIVENNLSLKPLQLLVNFDLTAETRSAGAHGYWWLLPNADFTKLVAVQGRHPPALTAPGHVLMLDRSGKELWRVETTTDCWGLDISSADNVAVGCNDGTTFLISSEGEVLWSAKGGQNREVKFSPDGEYLLSNVIPIQDPNQKTDAYLLETKTGKMVWQAPWHDAWLRAAAFSPDGEYIVAGFSGGRTTMFKQDGTVVWERFIGEFPMVFEIDQTNTVFAAGKNRELFSFDGTSELRFRYRIPDHVVTAGSNSMSADGSLIMVGTVGGWLYAFDHNGLLLWRRRLDGELQGHNALDVTPDGQYILVGTAGLQRGNVVQLFNRSGTLLWSYAAADARDTDPTDNSFDHNHRGAITVAISDDGRTLAAGYGDSTIRLFTRE